MVPNIEYDSILLLGIVFYIRNIILLGSTTQKNTIYSCYLIYSRLGVSTNKGSLAGVPTTRIRDIRALRCLFHGLHFISETPKAWSPETVSKLSPKVVDMKPEEVICSIKAPMKGLRVLGCF